MRPHTITCGECHAEIHMHLHYDAGTWEASEEIRDITNKWGWQYQLHRKLSRHDHMDEDLEGAWFCAQCAELEIKLRFYQNRFNRR